MTANPVDEIAEVTPERFDLDLLRGSGVTS
jgi:hypothetical protein